jgi:hypothetical protein
MTRVHACRPGRSYEFPLRFHVDASLLAGEVAAPPALVASYNYHCSKKKVDENQPPKQPLVSETALRG